MGLDLNDTFQEHHMTEQAQHSPIEQAAQAIVDLEAKIAAADENQRERQRATRMHARQAVTGMSRIPNPVKTSHLSVIPATIPDGSLADGRAPRSGRGGRRFKSCHSDQRNHDKSSTF
jgi:hypothetical protein